MVLVQEMALKLDQGFLAAVIDLFTPATDPEAEKQKVVTTEEVGVSPSPPGRDV